MIANILQQTGIGHAVVGDQKYGKEDRDHTRLALHARSISFKHPFNGEQLTFESKVPVYFTQLVGRVELKVDQIEILRFVESSMIFANRDRIANLTLDSKDAFRIRSSFKLLKPFNRFTPFKPFEAGAGSKVQGSIVQGQRF